MLVAMSIRLMIGPEARIPLSGTPTSFSCIGEAELDPVLAMVVIGDAERAAMADLARHRT